MNRYEAVQAAPSLPVGDQQRAEELRKRQEDVRIQMGSKSLIARPYNEELRRLGRL